MRGYKVFTMIGRAGINSIHALGGLRKMLSWKCAEAECAQIWWDGLPEGERNVIKNLPNFDPEIFKACTGIRIEET